MLAILSKKTDYDTKVNETEKKITDHKDDKYITTPEFIKLTAENFAARLAQANLVTKPDFDDEQINLSKKITSNKVNHLLVENELEKVETFDSVYFRGKSHFEDDGAQNYLVFQTVSRYFKTICAIDSNILSWKFKGLSDKSIKPPATSNKIVNPSLDFVGTKARVKFNRDCLK